MDLDLKIELRLWLKEHGLPARLTLDSEGYKLCLEWRKERTVIVLPDAFEESILELLDDVSPGRSR